MGFFSLLYGVFFVSLLCNKIKIMNNVLKLDSERLDGYSIDSPFDADFFIRKISESKTGYKLWISDSDGYLGKKFSAPQYISTLCIHISKRIKKNGDVLVSFSLDKYGSVSSDFDFVEVPFRTFVNQSFIPHIGRELSFYFQKMCEAHNEWVVKYSK